MDRKFESELGKRVAEKNGHGIRKKASALVGAVAICALMVSCALTSVAENQPAKDSGIMFDSHVDYIFGDDDEVDMKRTMTLKNKTMIANGESETTYTAFNYTVNISVNDDDVDEVQYGAMIGSLEIWIDDEHFSDDTPTLEGTYDAYWELVAIDDSITSATVSGSVQCEKGVSDLAEFSMPFDVVVPDGFKLSLSLTLTFEVGFLSGEVEENGDSEHSSRFDPVESYPGPRWLLF